MSRNNWIVGIGADERRYRINGVTYVVSSVYAPSKTKVTLSDKLEKYLNSPFADLTIQETKADNNGEYACSAAGEED